MEKSNPIRKKEKKKDLTQLDDGHDKSPTVMVGEATNKTKLGKNRGILKPSWAFVKTKREKHIEKGEQPLIVCLAFRNWRY